MVQSCAALRVVRRSLPVVVKRSAPNRKVEDLHNNICGYDVGSGAFHDDVLGEVLSEAPVEQEQTAFTAPLDGTHALLDEKDGFGSPGTFTDLFRRQFDGVGRVDQVGVDIKIDIEEDDEDRVQALGVSVGQV